MKKEKIFNNFNSEDFNLYDSDKNELIIIPGLTDASDIIAIILPKKFSSLSDEMTKKIKEIHLIVKEIEDLEKETYVHLHRIYEFEGLWKSDEFLNELSSYKKKRGDLVHLKDKLENYLMIFAPCKIKNDKVGSREYRYEIKEMCAVDRLNALRDDFFLDRVVTSFISSEGDYDLQKVQKYMKIFDEQLYSWLETDLKRIEQEENI